MPRIVIQRGGKRIPYKSKKKVRNMRTTGPRRIVPRNNRNVNFMRSWPFPQRLFTQLAIVEHNGLISALTGVASLVYRPTSYFDFYPAVGGPSYGGYSTYAAMYDRYRVLAFKYTCIFTNLEADSVTVSCQAIADTSTPPSGTATDYTENAIENIYGKFRVLSPTASNPTQVIKGYVNCSKLWGTPETKTDTNWASTSGSNPTANSWLRVAALRNNGAALATGVQFLLRVKSYGYWDERIDKTS